MSEADTPHPRGTVEQVMLSLRPSFACFVFGGPPPVELRACSCLCTQGSPLVGLGGP